MTDNRTVKQQLYIFYLGGNIRKNPKRSGTTHHIFGIQVGVSVIAFFIEMRYKRNEINN